MQLFVLIINMIFKIMIIDQSCDNIAILLNIENLEYILKLLVALI